MANHVSSTEEKDGGMGFLEDIISPEPVSKTHVFILFV